MNYSSAKILSTTNSVANTSSVNDATAQSYDEIPYQGVAYQQTHPRRLATLASLFGIPFSPPAQSRILELGCAEGGNLIPMATDYPNSEFLGIDLSEKQIVSGNHFIEKCNLKNIRLEQQDIMNFSPSEGKFDYIILHGFYSWVPEDVRQRVLKLCQDHLSETGLAFISFNAYPGGHIRSMVRDMLKFHSRNENEGQQKVQKAREFYDILLDTVGNNSGMYSTCLNWEQKHVKDVPDHSVRHETLSENNETFYFTDFMKEAEKNDLQYVGDLRFASMFPIQGSEENHQKLARSSQNRIEYEQYLDFINFRVFRETVLRKKNNQPEIALNFDINLMKNYHYSTELKANKNSDSSEAIQFKHPTNSKEITTSSAVVQNILFQLIERWPENIPFEAILAEVQNRFPQSNSTELSAQLSQVLFEFYKTELIDLSLFPFNCTKEVSTHPCTSPLSRNQLSHDLSITNQKHAPVLLNDLQKLLLPHLTGENNQSQLVDFLLEAVKNGQINLNCNGQNLKADDPSVRTELESILEQQLQSLAQLGLLISR